MANTGDKGVLIDTTRCIGCRGCQVACKQWNGLPAEKTVFFTGGSYQNPPNLSSRTYTLVTYNEVDHRGKLRFTFAKRQCMHCQDPACASACPVGALARQPNGSVNYDSSKCIGCRYCMLACPWQVPKYEWEKAVPFVRKCTMCVDRQREGGIPACVKTCPSNALEFGAREELLVEARRRIQARPERYVDHIYGEREAGGTGVLYLASVPFAALGFPAVPLHSAALHSDRVMAVLPWWVGGLTASLAGLYWLTNRKQKAEPGGDAPTGPQEGGEA